MDFGFGNPGSMYAPRALLYKIVSLLLHACKICNDKQKLDQYYSRHMVGTCPHLLTIQLLLLIKIVPLAHNMVTAVLSYDR